MPIVTESEIPTDSIRVPKKVLIHSSPSLRSPAFIVIGAVVLKTILIVSGYA